MSRAGAPSNRNGNGGTPGIPDDLIWNEDEPPFIYSCSQDIKHDPKCDGNCEGRYPLESEVQLMNLGRAYARIGMSYKGVVDAYAGIVPVKGFRVDPFDLLVWLEVLKETLDIDSEELEEKFRQRKIKYLTEVYEINAPAIQEAKTQQALGIVKKQVLGPDGQPL